MFLLFQIADFFPLNGQRQSCQTGCLIIWFKNQTKLLSPVIIFLTDFETDHQSYTTNCRGGGGGGGELCFNSIASPRPGYHLVFLTCLLNFHSNSLGFWDCQALPLERKARSQKSRANMAQPKSCPFAHSHPFHERVPCLNMTVTALTVISFRRGIGATSTDERGLGLNFMSNWSILLQINMYIAKYFYRLC